MKAYFLIAILFLSFPCVLMAQSAENSKAIDRSITKKFDVTGDGKSDEITLHLKAENINSPFKWTLTIISDKKIIFTHDSDDTWLDRFFNDAGFASDCGGYISCKEKYYYHDILDSIILTGNKWYDLNGILDKSKDNTLYPLGRKQLQVCCNITGLTADAILSKIENNLRNGSAVAINVLVSPLKSKPAMIFAPEVGRFLVIYEE